MRASCLDRDLHLGGRVARRLSPSWARPRPGGGIAPQLARRARFRAPSMPHLRRTVAHRLPRAESFTPTTTGTNLRPFIKPTSRHLSTKSPRPISSPTLDAAPSGTSLPRRRSARRLRRQSTTLRRRGVGGTCELVPCGRTGRRKRRRHADIEPMAPCLPKPCRRCRKRHRSRRRPNRQKRGAGGVSAAPSGVLIRPAELLGDAARSGIHEPLGRPQLGEQGRRCSGQPRYGDAPEGRLAGVR